jgi:hypothetical protein
MAGSLKHFKYTCDNGDVFAVLMDESNGEEVGNADFGPTDAGVITYFLPRNVTPRKATYRTTAGTESATIIVTSNTATVSSLPSTITLFSGSQAALTQFVGEVVRPVPTDVDTGLNDGDAT